MSTTSATSSTKEDRTRLLDPARLQLAYDLLREVVADGQLPSGLLAVATSQETIRREAHGPDGALPTDGIYLLASITKTIVATAVMQLVENGRLLVEDPVARYIPEFASKGKDSVTVWHLLTHTSGLDESFQHQYVEFVSPEQNLKDSVETGLVFPPGSRFSYCNAAFRVLGELISRLGGEPYPEYLQNHVFGPSGMVDSSFAPDESRLPRVLPVHGESPSFQEWLKGFIASAHPAGGLFSTADDLIAFAQSCLRSSRGLELGSGRSRVLGPAAIETMTCLHTRGILEQTAVGLSPAYWGLGWQLYSPTCGMLFSIDAYHHGGATGTELVVDPVNDLIVVFLTNKWGGDDSAKRRILNAVVASLE